MAEGGSKRINVVVKTPKDKKTVEVDEDSGIKDVSTGRVTFPHSFRFAAPLSCPSPINATGTGTAAAGAGASASASAGTVHFGYTIR